VTSRGTPQFWQLYRELPNEIQTTARKAYLIFLNNPAHPGLHLERLKSDRRAWSVRITRDYRAVALRSSSDDWLWLWIGTHREFDRRFSV
jgi:hypothetical protein